MASVLPTVRDCTFAQLRRLEMTTLFANPGSTEVPFLLDLPDDLDFVLGLHEAAVVGTATGYALASGRPALVLLHTTAGLGNAVAALATARVNRAPLVVLVGQQDRRHLAQQPFLAGRLAGLAGDYPVAFHSPVRAADVPGTIVQSHHEAITGRGPVLIIVPQDDWAQPGPAEHEVFGPDAVLRPAAGDEASVAAVAERLATSVTPALVVGAGADGPRTWIALTALAERLGAPVWQEAFSAQAGFPQDHPLFSGQLPADREALRAALAPHDCVLTVGAGAFRQYPYVTGPLVEEGTTMLLVADDPDEVHRSPVDLAVLAPPGPFCEALLEHVAVRETETAGPRLVAAPPPPPGPPLRADHVLAALADLLDPETVLFEEAPSSKAQLHRRLLVRRPFGFLTPAMGGLGFALPAAVGVRMALPERPVVAVLGDGSSLYAIQALWTAARYEVGALFVVLANRRYAIMDKLARRAGGNAPWPSLDGVSVSAIARGFGADAITVTELAELHDVLEQTVPRLSSRRSPLVIEAVVAVDEGTAL